jgi:hypothetical protein
MLQLVIKPLLLSIVTVGIAVAAAPTIIITIKLAAGLLLLVMTILVGLVHNVFKEAQLAYFTFQPEKLK